MGNATPRYYLVDAQFLPEIFLKVTEAKELLQTGAVATIAEAAARVGISRSAFYKYKDAVTPFQDMKSGHILTFHILLLDKPGVLSSVLGLFAQCSANILTINQSIPVNGTANVTISAETSAMTVEMEAMLEQMLSTRGVIKAEILAG